MEEERVRIFYAKNKKEGDALLAVLKANGVEGMRMHVQKLEMSEVPLFSKMMSENLFMYFDDIDAQVEDRVAKSLLSSNGTVTAAIKRLNSSRDWVGSIFCEFMEPPVKSREEIQKALHDAAINIQYNLPEFQEEKSPAGALNI